MAYKREYNVIDNAGDVETIRVDIDSRTIPLIKFMPNKELLLAGPVAGQDHFGIYVELTGRPANRSPVNWSRPPSAVGAWRRGCTRTREVSALTGWCAPCALMPVVAPQRTASPTSSASCPRRRTWRCTHGRTRARRWCSASRWRRVPAACATASLARTRRRRAGTLCVTPPPPSSGVDTTLSSPRPRRAAGTPWLTLACLPRRRMCRCSSRCLAR